MLSFDPMSLNWRGCGVAPGSPGGGAVGQTRRVKPCDTYLWTQRGNVRVWWGLFVVLRHLIDFLI